MLCEYCNVDQKDLLIFVLPCGYSVCYDHIKSQDILFKCFKCGDHMIDKESCLNIRKNQEKLNKLEYLEKKEFFLKKCDQLDLLKKVYEQIITDHFSKIVSEIDLKRECLKYELNDQVDKYSLNLIDYVKKFEVNSIDAIRQKLDSLDTVNMRSQLDNHKILACKSKFLFENEEKTNYSELDTGKFDQIFENLENIKQFRFEQIDTDRKLNISEFFGTVKTHSLLNPQKKADSKALNPKNQNLTSCCEQFSLIGSFDSKKFEELDTGEIISTSISNPSNLLKIDPINGQKAEISLEKKNNSSKIEFFVRTEGDELILFNNKFCVSKFQNGIYSKCFQLNKKPFLFIELFKSELYTIDLNNFVSKREYSIGKLVLSFQINNEVIYSMKVLKKNKILTGNDNKIILWNVCDGKQLETFKTSGRILAIEKINERKFVTGCDEGIISIWDTQSKSRVFKKCHDCAIRCIQVYPDGDILSLGSEDGKIKKLDPVNLNFTFELNIDNKTSNPNFFRLLKSGRLVYLDSNGAAYASLVNI